MSQSSFLGRSIRVNNADAAYASTLEDLLDNGIEVSAGESLSIASGKTSKELLNHVVIVDNPTDRLLRKPYRRLNLSSAVARFAWMMAGSDRLADIAFYEPKVTRFTDDGVSVPGSNYGQRILQARPGLNQLVAVIGRLKEEPGSRRAAISIYHPEDAVRPSHDIPCAFGMFYHLREDELHATTVMRSNNAFILLPYNIFEFSLLAEIVAVEVGVPLGSLTHIAASMHVFEDNYDASRRVIAEASETTPIDSVKVPLIPSDDSPVEQVRELVKLEAELRHGSVSLGDANIEEWIGKGEDRLNYYWRQLYYLLALHVAQRNDSAGALGQLATVIESPWKEFLPDGAFEASGKSPLPLDEVSAFELGEEIIRTKVIPLHRTKARRALLARLAERESEKKADIGWKAFAKLEDRLGERLAARGVDEIGAAEIDELLDDVLSSEDAPPEGE